MNRLGRVLGQVAGVTVTPHTEDAGRLVLGYPCGLVLEVAAGLEVADLVRAALEHVCTSAGDAPTRAGARRA